jgi:threonine/homoserine efflux transporter RhtA
VERIQVVEQAVALAAAGLATLAPRATPEEAADAMGLVFARAMAAVQGSLRPSP